MYALLDYCRPAHRLSQHIWHKPAHFPQNLNFLRSIPLSPPPDSIEKTNAKAQSGIALSSRFSESQLFKDYARAFRQATGLPLAIRPAKAYHEVLQKQYGGNPFCMLLARTNAGCANCVKMQADLEKTAGMKPKSLHCFAGLCDSAVPIRVGG